MKAMLLEHQRRSGPRRCGWPICRSPSRGRARCASRCAAVPSAAPICTSSRAICRHRKCPSFPGHQIVGRVDALGPECRSTSETRPAGRRRLAAAHVRAVPVLYAGRENLCESARFTGYHADGGYAEYAVVPEAFAYAIPSAFGDVEAAPLLCAGIIGYRALGGATCRRAAGWRSTASARRPTW